MHWKSPLQLHLSAAFGAFALVATVVDIFGVDDDANDAFAPPPEKVFFRFLPGFADLSSSSLVLAVALDVGAGSAVVAVVAAGAAAGAAVATGVVAASELAADRLTASSPLKAAEIPTQQRTSATPAAAMPAIARLERRKPPGIETIDEGEGPSTSAANAAGGGSLKSGATAER